MSKQDNPLALLVAFAIAAGLAIAGLSFFGIGPNKLFEQKEPSGRSQPNSSNSSNSSDSSPQLTVLADTFSGYSTFRHPDFKQALAKAGINLGYEDEFDQAKRAARLGKDAQLIATTLDQFLQQQPDGKIIALIDRTVGADAAVLNTVAYPNLKSLEDLQQLVRQQSGDPGDRKLSIAFAGDTPSEYLALVLDIRFEAFDLADFNIIRVADASEAWNLLSGGDKTVAIAIIWEPFVTRARQQGYTVVLSSKDAPKAILDVIVASNDFLAKQPEAISQFLESYYRRIQASVGDSSKLQAQIAKDGDLSTEEAAAVLAGINFFTAPQAHQWMTDGTLEKRIASTAAVLALAERVPRTPENPASLYAAEAIEVAAESTQALIELVRKDNPELADLLSGKSDPITAAPPASAQDLTVAPTVGNLNVRGEVKFEAGSVALAPEGITTLDNLATEIREFNPNTIAVRAIGHTSKSGAADYNQKLSEQRAQAVVNYLKSLRLPHKLVPEGKGFSAPISGMSPQDPRQQRTEIRLVRID